MRGWRCASLLFFVLLQCVLLNVGLLFCVFFLSCVLFLSFYRGLQSCHTGPAVPSPGYFHKATNSLFFSSLFLIARKAAWRLGGERRKDTQPVQRREAKGSSQGHRSAVKSTTREEERQMKEKRLSGSRGSGGQGALSEVEDGLSQLCDGVG